MRPLRIGYRNEMAQTSVVQITAMYCHGHFSPKVAKHLHSFRKNTKKIRRSGFATGGGAVAVRTFGGENIEGVDESGKSVFLISSSILVVFMKKPG